MNTYKIHTQIKELAIHAMARYPQYKGHFDNYVLVLIKRTVKTKMGVAFTKGEWAIANPELRSSVGVDGKTRLTMTVWSVSNNCDTSVLAKDLEVLA